MSDKRVAIISIIAENRQSSAEINALLSDFGEYIVGMLSGVTAKTLMAKEKK